MNIATRNIKFQLKKLIKIFRKVYKVVKQTKRTQNTGNIRRGKKKNTIIPRYAAVVHGFFFHV